MHNGQSLSIGLLILAAGWLSGCGGEQTPAPGDQTASPPPAATTGPEQPSSDSEQAEAPPARTSYRPVQLGGGTAAAGTAVPGSTDAAGRSATGDQPPPKFEEVVAALKPVQILLGNWTGILSRSSSNESHQWVWDLKTDPTFPALVLKSPEGQFFRELRLTYDPRRSKFLMTSLDADQVRRTYEGEYVEPPQDQPSEDGRKVERTFRLQLTEAPGQDSTRWQFLFNLQHNNRYLVEVRRARGRGDFQMRDVIGTQRDGVSFAKADDDYGDRTCVISGGLGTMSVSYKGKSYYVCCSGCQAAFNDDPERWIARFNEQQMAKQQQ